VPRKLKLYRTQIGFFDTIVAAPSQAAALRAWGVHQNLFAEGRAEAIDDSKAMEAAAKHPEQPLRRAIGSNGAWEPSTAGPSAAQAGARQGKTAAQRKPPSHKRVERAQAALAKLEADWTERQDAFHRRQAEFDAELRQAEADHAARRRRAEETLSDARRAYHAAGGKL
jgi:hypothetical protein